MIPRWLAPLAICVSLWLAFPAILSAQGLPAVPPQAAAPEDDYYFDTSLLRGGRLNPSALAKVSRQDAVLAGKYRVDLYVNDHYIDSSTIEFIERADKPVKACLTADILQITGIKVNKKEALTDVLAEPCWIIDEVIAGAVAQFDIAQLRFNLSVPQKSLANTGRGSVPLAALDYGSNLAYLNYISNYYHVKYSDSRVDNQDAAWFAINSGINIAGWQLRHISNINWNRSYGTHWTRLRSYVQSPIPQIGSQFSVGELTTNGKFFAGLAYNGVKLASDDRMLPESLRGYAPSVRGIASSNSLVKIYQNGQLLYQTSVATGPFSIDDLNPTSYSGDLDVEVVGANGETSRFSVPFSAIPDSIRPGQSRYNLAFGRSRDYDNNAYFGDLIYQYGLNNHFTLNTGLRFSDSYQAAMLGTVFTHYIGAFGFDATFSRARLGVDDYTTGWMAHLSYSKSFSATQTTVTLANYRYFTDGYRDLADSLGLRYDNDNGANNRMLYDDQQSERFDISINQSLYDYGSLYLAASNQSYRSQRSDDNQLQFGYSHHYKKVSYNLSLSRQLAGRTRDIDSRQETVLALSLSIPIGGDYTRNTHVSTGLIHSSETGSQYQATLSGMIDHAQTLSYNMSASHDRYYRHSAYSGNIQHRLPKVTLSGALSKGEGYWQASANAQGSLALHSGGVTFGPYLSDTFALIEAKGAAGAHLMSAQQSTIDGQGYALMPAVTPYRFSRIGLDPTGMADDAELIQNEVSIAPVAGAAVKVVFKTRRGKPILIQAVTPDGQPLPLGAEVLDEQQTVIGIVALHGQLYLRTDVAQGQLTVRWGDQPDEHCALSYDITTGDAAQPMITLSATCQPSIHAPNSR